MTPYNHPSCTETYFERGARRWRDKEVTPLPVCRSRADNGKACFVSFWKPSPAEVENLRQGGCVQLRIYGDVHPVVNVETTSNEY